ncbi:DNA methyltransferase [Schaalia sp. lx-100]|uniref:DNA methyltransferase n=1 Tax=Schaalia sp. lx-100 TaxID=2899081 RepID=UPI001E4EB811|nr:DNA methyltransferase [Schaalia sp. lx-100]MCD4557328.1 hypothetical protein [Schaalia sp. lx-100]
MSERISSPIHDTPLGLLHPYWARKPMNIIELIVRELSAPGELVVDPFMGSGTIPFTAILSGRDAVGSDISPLSQYLAKATLQLIEGKTLLVEELERILSDHAANTEGWYRLGDGSVIERSRYSVNGTYKGGEFTLIPTETIIKVKKGGKWTGRRSLPADSPLLCEREVSVKDQRIVNFNEIALSPNSRIAIPEGALLAHYFTPENQASINEYLALVAKSPLVDDFGEALKLPLSAALPMLRLSDKKASSQWPYWRPKTNLTSRNPIMVFKSKLDTIKKFLAWSSRFDNAQVGSFNIFDVAAQDMTLGHLDRSARLVLTDPPYGDQVPYLEYANLWIPILGLETPHDAANKELVVSNSSDKRDVTAGYQKNLSKSLSVCIDLVGKQGIVAWFYQDHALSNWQHLYREARSRGFVVQSVIALPKQRRSLKTITSPHRTLDGDLLVVFCSEQDSESQRRVRRLTQSISESLEPGGLFAAYAKFLSQALQDGSIMEYPGTCRTVEDAIKIKEVDNVLAS